MATAAPTGKNEEENDILSSYYEQLADGIYKYGYETRDGSRKDVIMTPIETGEGVAYIEEGSYSYFGKNIVFFDSILDD